VAVSRQGLRQSEITVDIKEVVDFIDLVNTANDPHSSFSCLQLHGGDMARNIFMLNTQQQKKQQEQEQQQQPPQKVIIIYEKRGLTSNEHYDYVHRVWERQLVRWLLLFITIIVS
jgi:hypothetical protein